MTFRVSGVVMTADGEVLGETDSIPVFEPAWQPEGEPAGFHPGMIERSFEVELDPDDARRFHAAIDRIIRRQHEAFRRARDLHRRRRGRMGR